MQKYITLTLILVLQCFLYSQTNSTTWYVSPTGSGSQTGTDRGNAWSLSSMNQNLIQPGDYVYFGQGTYGQFSTTKAGSARHLITFMADPTNTDTVWFQTPTLWVGTAINLNKSYIRLKNIGARNSQKGIFITSSSTPGVMTTNVFVDSCIIRNNQYSIGARSGYEPTGGTPDDVNLDSVWVRWNYVTTSPTFQNGESDGITGRSIRRYYILGNYVEVLYNTSTGHNDCFQVSQGNGEMIIANNYFVNHKTEHSQISMTSVSVAPYKTVYYNNVARHYGVGSIFAHNAAYYIGFGEAPAGNCYILHNTTIGNGNNHFQLSEPYIVKNNIFYTFTQAGACWVYDPFVLGGNDYDYNMIYGGGGTTYPYANPSGSSQTFQWMYNKGQSVQDAMTTDMKFVDFNGENYSLQSTSPAKNYGTNLQALVDGWGIDGVEWKSFDNPYVSWDNPVPRGGNPTVGAWEFDNTGTGYNIEVNEGWNYISIPKLSNNMTADFLLPTRISSVFEYDGSSYNEVNVLQTAKGYAVEFGYPQYIFINGQSVYSPIPVSAGWNLIGVFDEEIPVSQITTAPSGILATNFVGYEGGYETINTLKPGKGYWVKVTSNGVLNLNSGSLGKGGEVNQQIAQINQKWGKIKISDSEANSNTLYVIEEDIESDVFELPPLPPKGMYDARYAIGKLVEDLSNPKEIIINSENYPVTIKVEGISLQISYKLNGKLYIEELNNGKEFKITNREISSIEVMRKIKDESLDSYKLSQNYPNPFNPSTSFKYSIPNASKVLIKVYDILGNEIETLVNEEKSAGTYEIEFNANGLPSGVYFYRLQAGTIVESKKMVLLK
ncbi:MAG: T9SS type A sorting domain-containing protein [Ignavibacteria bacterium]|nr:T9SS type A sorting domain-containing protein [Ignavibacteria bacterium]